jgi:hypothetical protein
MDRRKRSAKDDRLTSLNIAASLQRLCHVVAVPGLYDRAKRLSNYSWRVRAIERGEGIAGVSFCIESKPNAVNCSNELVKSSYPLNLKCCSPILL